MSSPPARFLCDAMLGRLARDLRLLGYDAAYARPTEPDAEVLRRARDEGRLLLTKDRALAAAAGADALLVPREGDELASVLHACGLRPRRCDLFTRCTECGGSLAGRARAREDDAPPDVQRVAVCAACGHLYWEGTHTAAIRARLAPYLVEE